MKKQGKLVKDTEKLQRPLEKVKGETNLLVMYGPQLRLNKWKSKLSKNYK